MKTHLYAVEIRWSDEDAGYIATVPALPGCSSYGAVRGEAAEQIDDAIAAWIKAAKKAGNKVPQPT